MIHWKWPAIVIALLATHVLACMFFIYLATSNPSFAVEEDYYRKAMHWDERRAQERRNAELGWTAELEVLPAPSVARDPILQLRLGDGRGAPVDGATVAAEAFFNARADRILRHGLEAQGDGVYSAQLPMRRPGRWEFRLVVERGEDRFTAVQTQHVILRTPPRPSP